jgi:hypothetical protein
MPATIKETSGNVYLEGIPPMRYGQHMDNSFIRSVQLSLNALGENYSYDYLMGITGAAFRIQFDPGWCPSSADATCGFDVSHEIFKSAGYSARFKRINHNSFQDIKDLYSEIKIQIDLGKPVVAINLMGDMEWGIITGYLKNEPGLLCRTFNDESEEYSIAKHAPWLNFFISDKNPDFKPGDLFSRSLKLAIMLAETRKFEEYYSGFAAYESWIEKIRQLADRPNSKDIQHTMEIHFILWNSLLDSRRAAFNYLTHAKTDKKLTGAQKIIACYEKIVHELEHPPQLSENKSGSDPSSEIAEMIRGQAVVLRKVYGIEKKAIQRIENELKFEPKAGI